MIKHVVLAILLITAFLLFPIGTIAVGLVWLVVALLSSKKK